MADHLAKQGVHRTREFVAWIWVGQMFLALLLSISVCGSYWWWVVFSRFWKFWILERQWLVVAGGKEWSGSSPYHSFSSILFLAYQSWSRRSWCFMMLVAWSEDLF
jgi:endonuclease/exonuclease/phosphatase (EEP) superfamily protein YafD